MNTASPNNNGGATAVPTLPASTTPVQSLLATHRSTPSVANAPSASDGQPGGSKLGNTLRRKGSSPNLRAIYWQEA
ncbi:hypothetical protein NMY22_g7756 [Coprinellus aureogranulatus]|nr:hypothetical protein NMY22_g7756 [Coprinellus aureogranulatus]